MVVVAGRPRWAGDPRAFLIGAVAPVGLSAPLGWIASMFISSLLVCVVLSHRRFFGMGCGVFLLAFRPGFADWDLQPRRRFRKFHHQSSATVGNHEYISSKFFAIFFFCLMFHGECHQLLRPRDCHHLTHLRARKERAAQTWLMPAIQGAECRPDECRRMSGCHMCAEC